MNQADRVKRAGILQIASLCVFCTAGLVGTVALMDGTYWPIATNVGVMIMTFRVYQTSSQIIVGAGGR